MPRPRPRWALVAAGLGLAWPALSLGRTLAATPLPIVLGAAVPAALWLGLVRRMDRVPRAPWRLVVAMVVWGAVVAPFVATHVNGWAGARLVPLLGEARATALTGALIAPVIEELAKGLALVVLARVVPRALGGVLDGILYGTLVGVGFAFAENVSYLTLATVQGGAAGLARGIWLRALLGGFNHAVFTATFGAGLGWARETTRPPTRAVAIGAGLVGAVGQHVAWNAVAARLITHLLCDPQGPAAACREAPAGSTLFVLVPLVIGCALGWGAAALAAIAVAARRDAARRA